MNDHNDDSEYTFTVPASSSLVLTDTYSSVDSTLYRALSVLNVWCTLVSGTRSTVIRGYGYDDTNSQVQIQLHNYSTSSSTTVMMGVAVAFVLRSVANQV